MSPRADATTRGLLMSEANEPSRPALAAGSPSPPESYVTQRERCSLCGFYGFMGFLGFFHTNTRRVYLLQ